MRKYIKIEDIADKKYLHLYAEQVVKYGLSLQIGVDISEEKAQKLIELDGEDIVLDSDEHYLVEDYFNETFAYDYEDYENVNIYIGKKDEF